MNIKNLERFYCKYVKFKYILCALVEKEQNIFMYNVVYLCT